MNNIFVVIYNTGSYDDARSEPVMSSFDNAKLENYIALQEKLFNRGKEVAKIIEDRMNVWQASNPKPSVRTPKLHTIPSFHGIKEKDITKEMREQRKHLQSLNAKLQSDSVQDLVVWGKARLVQYEQEKSTFTPEEQEWVNADHYSSWYIVEVPVME